jgi:hypothetical protein
MESTHKKDGIPHKKERISNKKWTNHTWKKRISQQKGESYIKKASKDDLARLRIQTSILIQTFLTKKRLQIF